jgi:prolyl oligopeptidase
MHTIHRLARPVPALLLVLLASTAAGKSLPPGDPNCFELFQPPYPATRKVDATEVRFGKAIQDPYRWLEDYGTREARQWIADQNRVTDEFLKNVPGQDEVRRKVEDGFSWSSNAPVFKDRVGASRPVDGWHYSIARDNNIDAPPRLVRRNEKTGATEVLADAAKWKGFYRRNGDIGDVTVVGNTLLYSVKRFGSDWKELRFIDLATGKESAERIRWVKSGYVSFTPDKKGFLYSAFPKPKSAYASANVECGLYYHALGTPVAEDRLVFSLPEGRSGEFSGTVETADRIRLDVWSDELDSNATYLLDAKDGIPVAGARMKAIVPPGSATTQLVDVQGDNYLFVTDMGANMRKLVSVDAKAPAPNRWKTIIAEDPERVLEELVEVDDRWVVTYVREGRPELAVFSNTGEKLDEIALPGPGTVSSVRAGTEPDSISFYFNSPLNPGETFRYSLKTRKLVSTWKSTVKGFDPSKYEFRMTSYVSKDGSKVPIQLLHRKGIPLDGNNPTLLYGYGGFEVNLYPGFAHSYLAWADLGGVVAIPNLRGGAEIGELWHGSGAKFHKQNVFDDFIAAAEWLVKEKITSPQRLAINGGSNGGLLVAASAMQRPDLFGAAVADVGVQDMVRFKEFTRGFHWVKEYGNADRAAELENLLAYSPLHNVTPGKTYPPMLIRTGSRDDRVSPVHSYKLAAALQAAQDPKSQNPILLRNYATMSHGPATGKDRALRTQELYAFLIRALKIQVK